MRFGDSRRPPRTSSMPTLTATSGTRCPACFRSGIDSEGSVPVEGWPAEADWHGWVDADELPAVLNPPSGQIVTANNEVDRSLPFVLTHDWVAPFRAQRILELLGERRNLDFARWRRFRPTSRVPRPTGCSSRRVATESVNALRTWDRRVDERPVAMLFEALEEALWRRTFADEMPQPLYDQFYRYAANERFAGFTSSSPSRTHHGSTIDPRPDVIETRARCHRARRPKTRWQGCESFGDRCTGGGTRFTRSTFSHPLAVAAACSTGSSAAGRFRSRATA